MPFRHQNGPIMLHSHLHNTCILVLYDKIFQDLYLNNGTNSNSPRPYFDQYKHGEHFTTTPVSITWGFICHMPLSYWLYLSVGILSLFYQLCQDFEWIFSCFLINKQCLFGWMLVTNIPSLLSKIVLQAAVGICRVSFSVAFRYLILIQIDRLLLASQ